jgi:hypothetical protein
MPYDSSFLYRRKRGDSRRQILVIKPVHNSFDAVATSIKTWVSSTDLVSIRVQDNGHRIHVDGRVYLAKHSNSRTNSPLAQARHPPTDGFQRIALAWKTPPANEPSDFWRA